MKAFELCGLYTDFAAYAYLDQSGVDQAFSPCLHRLLQ